MSMEELHGDARMQWSLDGTTPLRLANYPYLSPGKSPAVEWTSDPKFGHLETREQVNTCVRDCREGGPRFPRPQSNAPRHRNARRPGGRSRIAPLLSPLRARPALRCSRKARVARPAAQGRRSQSDFPTYVRFFAWPSPGTKPRQRAAAPAISARLSGRARLETHSNGAIVAHFDTHTVSLGTFGTAAAACAGELRTGLPLSSLTPGSGNLDKEVESAAPPAGGLRPVGLPHRRHGR